MKSCYVVGIYIYISADPPVGGVSEIPKVFFLDAFLHFFTPLESLKGLQCRVPPSIS